MDGLHCETSGPTITLGGHEPSDPALRLGPFVSGQHARIVRDRGRFWPEELRSRNVTHRGDRRIQDRPLIGPGTLFTVGWTTRQFSTR